MIISRYTVLLSKQMTSTFYSNDHSKLAILDPDRASGHACPRTGLGRYLLEYDMNTKWER